MRRLLVPTDVPIHRPSVGAMALAAGSQMPDQSTEFKPYVYRGTGEDQYDMVVIEEPKPKKRKAKPKPKPKPPYVPSRSRYRPPLRIEDESTWGNWRRQPKWVRETYTEPEPEPEQEPVLDLAPPEKPAKPIRPAPGWRPTSGDDIDAMLNELGLDE